MKLITKIILFSLFFHILFILAGPYIVTYKLDRDIKQSMKNIDIEKCGERWVDGVLYVNTMCLINKESARKPNPDFIYTLIPYDLSNGNALISSPVVLDKSVYWSVHVHNKNTEAFFKRTNLDINKNKFDFVVTNDPLYKNQNLTVAIGKSTRGYIIFRCLIKDFSNYEKLDKFRRTTTIKYISNGS